MKLQMFSTKDEKGFFYPAWHAPSIPVAIRSFGDEAARQSPDNIMNRYPQDFTLWHLGEFDQDTGIFTSIGQPRYIARASDILAGTQGRLAIANPDNPTDALRTAYNGAQA